MADTGKPALKPISQLKTAADLSRKLDSLRKARMAADKETRLNIAFYRGNQYATWNPHINRGRGGIQTLPTEDGEKPRYRVRIVANQIVVGIQSLVSKLIKTKPIWSATPGTPGDKAVKAAQCAEELLESWWASLNLGSKYQEALIWSLLGANGYWYTTWDKYAAKSMKFLMDPKGQPITDDGLEAEFRAQLQQAGIDPALFERVAYMGEVKVEVMSPMDVYGDPGAKSAEEWKWCILRFHLEPDEIKVRWPKAPDLKPDAIPMGPEMAAMGGHNQADPTLKAVYCMYVLPSPTVPKGRYVCFVEDPDTILEDTDWPFPVRMLPVHQFKGIRVPGGAENEAIVTHVRPLQKQLNRLLSQIVEYTNMVIKPRVWAPVNSLRQRLTTEPGAVYEYTPVGNMRPEIEQLPSIPPYVFEFLNDVGARIRDLFGLTEVTEGQLPPNLEAADAIDLLQEMATDRFAPAIMDNEATLARAGTFLLGLAQAYYEEPRLLQIQGLGGSTAVKEFSKADIAGEMTVKVEAGSSMPRSRAARRQQIEKWVEMGLITPQRAWKYYDIADVKDLALQFQLDEDHALREHEKMIQGVPLNPEAVQQAMKAVSQGINPDTGQPLVDPNTGQQTADPQEILQRAALKPYLAEDMQVHLEKHGDYIKSIEFDSLDPEVRQRFLTHYEITLNTWRTLPQLGQPDAPKVTLQLRGSVGPTTAAEILKRGGVPEADPMTIANEPPLETMITDSIDKPDADADGPGREANHLSNVASALVTAQIANADAQQKNAHQQDAHEQAQTHDATNHQIQAAQAAQKMRHAEELHQIALQTAHANAKAAEKRANAPVSKPGGSTGRPKKPQGK